MAERETLKELLLGSGKRKPEEEPLYAEEVDAPQDIGPCGQLMPKSCVALDIERGGAQPVVTFQYVYLAVCAEFTPTKFWGEFIGEKTWRVTVAGRNLRPLFDRLNDHCLRKLRKIDRDFEADNGKPVVTGLDIDEVKD